MKGRALLQSDVVGDVGEGAFALLLEPGIRHCGFRCRVSDATVMRVVGELGAWDGEGAVWGKDGMFTGWSCLQLGVFG